MYRILNLYPADHWYASTPDHEYPLLGWALVEEGQEIVGAVVIGRDVLLAIELEDFDTYLYIPPEYDRVGAGHE